MVGSFRCMRCMLMFDQQRESIDNKHIDPQTLAWIGTAKGEPAHDKPRTHVYRRVITQAPSPGYMLGLPGLLRSRASIDACMPSVYGVPVADADWDPDHLTSTAGCGPGPPFVPSTVLSLSFSRLRHPGLLHHRPVCYMSFTDAHLGRLKTCLYHALRSKGIQACTVRAREYLAFPGLPANPNFGQPHRRAALPSRDALG